MVEYLELGPLLFLGYMPSQIHYGKLLQYADDTTQNCTGVDYCQVRCYLCEDLQHVSNQITSSKMQLNILKSSLMWFKPKSFHHHNYFVAPVCINYKSHHPEILFDDKLQWNFHASTIWKVSKVIYHKGVKMSFPQNNYHQTQNQNPIYCMCFGKHTS